MLYYLEFYVTASNKHPSSQTPFISRPSVYINLPFPCLKLLQKLLYILSEVPFINASIWPNVSAVSAFFVVLIWANINIRIDFGGFPCSMSMSHSFLEIALKHWCIGPGVFSLSMELSPTIFSSILITIHKHFSSVSFFNRFNKCSFVILFGWEFQHSVSIFLSVFPLSLIYYFCRSIIVSSLAAFNSINPLAVVNVTVCWLHNARTVLFPIHELAFVNMFIRNYLNPISCFFTRTILFSFPSTNIELAIIMPKYSFWPFCKDNTIFVFFHVEINIIIMNLNVKYVKSLLCQIHQLILIIWNVRCFW